MNNNIDRAKRSEGASVCTRMVKAPDILYAAYLEHEVLRNHHAVTERLLHYLAKAVEQDTLTPVFEDSRNPDSFGSGTSGDRRGLELFIWFKDLPTSLVKRFEKVARKHGFRFGPGVCFLLRWITTTTQPKEAPPASICDQNSDTKWKGGEK